MSNFNLSNEGEMINFFNSFDRRKVYEFAARAKKNNLPKMAEALKWLADAKYAEEKNNIEEKEFNFSQAIACSGAAYSAEFGEDNMKIILKL